MGKKGREGEGDGELNRWGRLAQSGVEFGEDPSLECDWLTIVTTFVDVMMQWNEADDRPGNGRRKEKQRQRDGEGEREKKEKRRRKRRKKKRRRKWKEGRKERKWVGGLLIIIIFIII